MADTKPIHKLNETAYVSANTLASINVGTDMSVQNQSRGYVKLSISVTQPAVDTEAYILIPPNAAFPAIITGESSSVWLLGNGPVSIQEG